MTERRRPAERKKLAREGQVPHSKLIPEQPAEEANYPKPADRPTGRPEGPPLSAKALRLHRLGELLPHLGLTEREIIIRLNSLRDGPDQTVDQVNQDLFGGTPVGEQKIRGLVRIVEFKINAFPPRPGPDPNQWPPPPPPRAYRRR